MSLYEDIVSRENIFAAIYAARSFIFEISLLSPEDQQRLENTGDCFCSEVDDLIESCRERLKAILTSDDLFTTSVCFRIKGFNKEEGKPALRPIHFSDLETQICIMCIMQQLIFNQKDGARTLSGLSALIPSNFYGNRISRRYEHIFVPWQKGYREYTDAIQRKYKKYQENLKYKYYVQLDLKNFFPSINPRVVFAKVSHLLSNRYSSPEDREMLARALTKCLVLKVSNSKPQDLERYYTDRNGPLNSTDTNFTVGLPQGLPQSYFFANLIMADIAKIYNAHFKGEALYYVDDSAIFTNEVSPEDFDQCIEAINKDIEEQIKSYLNEEGIFCFEEKGATLWRDDVFRSFEQERSYLICVHSEEKSHIDSINNTARFNRGYLRSLGIEASRVSLDLYLASSEQQDDMTLKKITVWLDALGLEAHDVKERIKEFQETGKDEEERTAEAYLKELKRYQRFFKYRKFLLETSSDEGLEQTEKDLEKLIHKLKDSDCNEMIDDLDSEIVAIELQKLKSHTNKIDDIAKKYFDLEGKLLGSCEVTSYVKESYERLKGTKRRSKYETLTDFVANGKKTRWSAKDEEELKKIRDVLDSFSKSPIDFESLCDHIPSYAYPVLEHSNELKRRILNACISQIIGVEATDGTINGMRLRSYQLRLFELRLLVWVRNKRFKIEDAKDLLQILDEEDTSTERGDLLFLNIVPILLRRVKWPARIDQLVLAHQYVSGLWLNGSKYLHFYTLHNVEHSVELIKIVDRICTTIDWLSLKTYDFFVVFMACYLHDIAMAQYPDSYDFVGNASNSRCDVKKIISSVTPNMREAPIGQWRPSDLKRFMVQCYECVDSFFEQTIRDNHAKDSADLIKHDSSVAFLNTAEKDLIACISQAHGWDSSSIYGLKSTAASDLVSKKKAMILLRLADVLDVSSDRIKVGFLEHNLHKMPSLSGFHYIGHMAISGCELESTYFYKKSDEGKWSDVHKLDPSRFFETIRIRMELAYDCDMPVSKMSQCDFNAKLIKEPKQLQVQPRGEDESGCEHCRFLCKWMMKKNHYLFTEFRELIMYLKHIQEGKLFCPELEIDIVPCGNHSLKPEYLDVIRDNLD